LNLTIGSNFNQKVDLPFGIKYLCLDYNNKKIIDYLSHGLKELVLGEIST
jgi:hypothetical protein